MSPTLFLLRHEIPEEIPVLKGWSFQYSDRKGSSPIVSRLSSLPPGYHIGPSGLLSQDTSDPI